MTPRLDCLLVTHNHSVGFLMSWLICVFQALVIAGIGDIARPAEKLSLSQSSALAATGNHHHQS